MKLVSISDNDLIVVFTGKIKLGLFNLVEFFSGSPRDFLANIFLNADVTECLFLEFLSNCPQKSLAVMLNDNLDAYDDIDLMEAYVPDDAPDDVDDSVEDEYDNVLCRVILTVQWLTTDCYSCHEKHTILVIVPV